MALGAACSNAGPSTPATEPSSGTEAQMPPPQVTIIPPPAASIASATVLLPSATIQPTPTVGPTVDPACVLFNANSDLLLPIVNRDSELSRDFEPPDLITPSLAYRNAYIVPIKIRQLVVEPLRKLFGAANEADLNIIAVSGYRSYEEQAVAYDKWQQRYPNRASTISAPPGHSEHQLGTAIDFSTSTMEEQYGELFHTDFFILPEGRWLYDNSAKFGFVLSYPAWAEKVTGYQWEPWHYRYVGVELAQYLVTYKMTLTEYVKQCAPTPTPQPTSLTHP